MGPTDFDMWFVANLAKCLGRFRLFDLGVLAAIEHNVLGGFWYAALLFAFWVHGKAQGDRNTQRRILTTLLGSAVAILFTVLAGGLVSWLPPSRHPALAGFYPGYFEPNPNANCFPSQSTALYSVVAAGIYSLHKLLGGFLWVGVVILVGLPRIYVGGHYPSDVLAGLLCGLAGYAVVRHVLEASLVSRLQRLFDKDSPLGLLWEALVFAWILEVSLEFRDVVWLKNSLRYLTG